MKHIVSSKVAASLLTATLLSGALASSALASSALAQPVPEEPEALDKPDAAEAPTESAASSGAPWLSVRGILGVALGQSLFREDPPLREDVDVAFDRTSYWSVSYLVVPEATLGEFDLSLGLMLEQRMTETPDDEAEFGLGETLFNVRWKGYELDDIDLSFSPTATVVFPTSDLSDRSRLLFGTELALDVRQRLFDIVEIAANVGWRKNFHRSETWTLTPSIDGDSTNLAGRYAHAAHAFYPTFYRGGASLSRPQIDGGGVNSSSVLHLGLGLEVRLPADLAVHVGYSLYTSYLYEVGEDLALAPGVGDPDAESDRLSTATFDLRYSPLEWLSIGAGTATTQPTHTPDNESLRFPFWHFSEGYPSDMSTIRVYAIGRY